MPDNLQMVMALASIVASALTFVTTLLIKVEIAKTREDLILLIHNEAEKHAERFAPQDLVARVEYLERRVNNAH